MVYRYGGDPDVLLYIDPPYPGETRSARKDAPTDGYRIDMATATSHTELWAALRTCKSAVVVSGWRNTMYDSMTHGWYVEEFPTQSAIGGRGKATCEVLWSNRPLGGRVQPTLFDGADE
jgi:DNA adenine methylase